MASRTEAATIERSGLRGPWSTLRDRPGVALLLALALGAVLELVLALRIPIPAMYPDEFRYAHLARSLADGDGFVWRGEHVHQTTALYIYLLTPLWAIWHSTVDAYAASKVLGTAGMIAQAAVVYAAGRHFAGRGGALMAALLTLCGSWMIAGATIATEAVAMPLSTAALLVAARGIQRDDQRARVGALILAALAAWARAQLLFLVPALVVAFALDVVRIPGERRARLARYRVLLIAAAALAAVVLLAVALKPSVVGDYSPVAHFRPSIGHLLGKIGLEAAGLVAAAGVLPAALVVGTACTGAAWRDPRSGPLLCVLVPAALSAIVVAGFFLTGHPEVTWGIERYVWYGIPVALLLLVLIAREPALRPVRVLAIAATVAALCALRPSHVAVSEERATWALGDRLHGIGGLRPGLAVALTGVLALVVLVAALRSRRAHAPLLAAVAMTAFVLVVQQQASWQATTHITRAFRAVMPRDLMWLDHHAGGPVALLGVTSNAPAFEVVDFFNRDVTQAYVPATGLPGRDVAGRLCAWSAQSDGTLELQSQCGPPPRRLLVDDPLAHVTFADEVSVVREPFVGRIATLAPVARPRLRSLILTPCPRPMPRQIGLTPKIAPAGAPQRCTAQLRALTWLDAPARLVVRYAGGTATRTVVGPGTRSWSVPPRRVTTLSVPVGAGASDVQLRQSWTWSGGNPRLLSVGLAAGGRTTPLL